MSDQADYLTGFKGRFVSALRWEQLDTLWEAVRRVAGRGWYVYAVGEPPPVSVASAEQVEGFIREVDRLLRREHEESYCGIVYADSLDDPHFIKVYDPNNLGVTCGFSESPPLPGWTLTTVPPVDLEVAMPPPGNRRRWWARLFG